MKWGDLDRSVTPALSLSNKLPARTHCKCAAYIKNFLTSLPLILSLTGVLMFKIQNPRCKALQNKQQRSKVLLRSFHLNDPLQNFIHRLKLEPSFTA